VNGPDTVNGRIEDGRSAGLVIVAGSGMGSLGERLDQRFRLDERVPFEEIPDLGGCTVWGHRGEVMLGSHPDTGRRLAFVSGRRHFYEGGDSTMAPLIDWLKSRGFQEVVTISAAGGVHNGLDPGELVVIQEIVDLQNRPKGYPRRGGFVRFFPSRSLTRAVEQAAGRARHPVVRGILACNAGPAYESPAEIRVLQEMDADVATMSAAPEAQFALSVGMEVAIIAAVTNRGTGIGGEPLDHSNVVDVAQSMCETLGDILVELISGPCGGANPE
jgi:purine-nucleoside phosphorylase